RHHKRVGRSQSRLCLRSTGPVQPRRRRRRRPLRGNTCPRRRFCRPARAWIMASEMRSAATSRTSKNCSGPRRYSYAPGDIHMNEYAEIKEKLADIFLQHLNIEVPASDTDLLASGIMDSLALVELLLRLEQTFGASVSIDDLELDNFRSLDSIAGFVAFHSAV